MVPGYYYAAATLPMLAGNEPAPMSCSEFLLFCREALSASDYAVVSSADAFIMNPEKLQTVNDPVLSSWHEYRRALNCELAAIRAESLQVDTETYAIVFRQVPEVMALARRIMTADTPLDADAILFAGLWRVLDELETNHFFDRTKFICYFLKLQLLERKALKTADRGHDVYRSVFSNISATG